MAKLASNQFNNRAQDMNDDFGTPAKEWMPLQDLRAWIGEGVLIRGVLDAVQSVCELDEDTRGVATRIPAGLPRTLVTILTYSYSVGILASQEIEARILRDPNLRYLAAGARPTWHDLRRFRRHERRVVREALSKTFELAWDSGLRSVAMTLGADAEPGAYLEAYRRVQPDTLLLFDRTADQRIQQAIMADSMALDE